MVFHPFEVSIPHITYTCLGGFVVLFGMFSLFLREKSITRVAYYDTRTHSGPYCAGIFDPRSWGGGNNSVTNTITLEFTRVVLAIGVFAIGVELPKAYMKRHWRSMFMLLAPVMTWGWFVAAGLIYALVPGLSFLSSLAVAACLTPTDPILAAAVVGGKYADKHVPAHIRHMLAAESGCNDGAAFPFLYIALFLIIDSTTKDAVRDWFLQLLLYQVLVGTCLGAVLGFSFRYLMKFCEKHDLIDRHSYVAQYVSLALLTIGITALLGSDDLLASFTCGTAFAWDGFFNRQTEESVFSSVIDLLFNIAAFVFVGAWMPFNDFQNSELTLEVWRLIVIAILILILKRLPIVVLLYKWIPDIKTFREAIFSGHFGPIGIGAVFISTLASQVLNDHGGKDAQTILLSKSIQPIVSFMVLVSILVHGLSIPGFSLGRRVHSVSRTWSRHTSLPEWATQARHVKPGEEIIVNRDDALERGELGVHQDEVSGEDSSDRAGTVQGSPGMKRSSADLSEAPPEEPPDGNAVLSEWKEGTHIVIEKRSGPGEEVEVEVIDEDSEDGDSRSIGLSLYPNREWARQHVRAYLDKLKQAPQMLEHATEGGIEAVQERTRAGVEEVENKVKSAEHHAQEQARHTMEKAKGAAAATITHEPEADVADQHLQDDDGDEGWISDDGAAVDDNGRPSSVCRGRSKFPKAKYTSRSGVFQTLRKRHSIRRVPSSAPATPTYVASTPPGSPPLSPRHRRIESLMMSHSRGVSPTRSVRFADPESRPSIGTPAESTRSELDSRSGVTFDLPKKE
ncbi:hypothetical protein FISHEDRAFT_70739 [Fistulina hepatica ATCC 64428]|uniref:Cation/H+ exchanger transmembrane domain-containing protein n=1 Tax=Fistulina hepatica ATCC 64428 TaxID=1128425 RepID=A0A0D7AI12_9AGAR|nr:hypothetical protein FISHEDRAFT_70739 [Fistulina hepatica ATCC 64428]